MSRVALLAVGAACGLVWWGVSLLLGARAYGALGTNLWAGAVAGACTGIAMARLSSIVYRRQSTAALYWYSPLSVYLAVALFGLFGFAMRVLLGDFHPDQIRWAVGVEAVLGMWWGITFLPPVAVVVQLLAYLNHRLLRRMVTGA
jgi:hypothetical protein